MSQPIKYLWRFVIEFPSDGESSARTLRDRVFAENSFEAQEKAEAKASRYGESATVTGLEPVCTAAEVICRSMIWYSLNEAEQEEARNAFLIEMREQDERKRQIEQELISRPEPGIDQLWDSI